MAITGIDAVILHTLAGAGGGAILGSALAHYIPFFNENIVVWGMFVICGIFCATVELKIQKQRKE